MTLPANIHLRNQLKRGPFRLTNITISSATFDPALDGYKILQLTDLHRGYLTSAKRVAAAIDLAVLEQPDLVVLTGDLVQLHHRTHPIPWRSRISKSIIPMLHQRRSLRTVVKELATNLSKISPPDGFLAVLGNHDYLDGARTVQRYLRDNVRWLINNGVKITRGGSVIEIAGIDDLWYGRPDLESTFESFSPSGTHFEQFPAFRLLLSHNPDITLDAPFPRGREPHLILAGHTHGGQIRLPVLGPVITHTQSKLHISGLTWCGNSAVYTCHGIGYGLLPIRFLCPAEILVVTFRRVVEG